MNPMLKTIIDRYRRTFRFGSASAATPKTAEVPSPPDAPPSIRPMEPRSSATPLQTEPESPIATLRRQCREIAYKAGLDNPSEEPDPFIESSLREGATSAALALSLSPEEFQMKDAQLLERVRKLDQQLKTRVSDRQTADANVRVLREKLATLGNEPYPRVQAILRWSAMIAISLSLAPTIHDFFPGLFQTLRWLIALGFSFAFALLIVTAILPDDQLVQDTPNNKKENIQ